MKALHRFVALLVCSATTLYGVDAAKPDKSLRALIRNSTLTVDADVVQPNPSGTVDEFITSYSARVRVREAIFGEASTGEVWVRVSGQQSQHAPRFTCLSSRQRCVLFVCPDDSGGTGFIGAAHLASARRYRPELVSAVRRLTKSK